MTAQANTAVLLAIDHNLAVHDVVNYSDSVIGVSREALLASPGEFQASLHPEDQALLSNFVYQGYRGEAMRQNFRMRDAGGKYRVLVATVSAASTNPDIKQRQAVVLEIQDARRKPSLLQNEMQQDEMQTMMRTIMESTDDYIFFKDTHHILLAGSQSMVALCPGINHWTEFANKSDYDLFAEDSADLYYALETKVYSTLRMAKELQPYLHKDGRKGWVDNRKYPILNEQRALVGLYGVARDVSVEIDLLQRKSLSASVFESAAESIVILDASRNIIDVNQAFERSTALHKTDIMGRSLQSIRRELGDSCDFDGLWRAVMEDGFYEGEVRHSNFDGTQYAEQCRINAVIDEEGSIHHYVCLYSDITALKHHEKELQKIANFDPLTGLVNRHLFEDRLEQSLANCERSGQHLALAYIDIDSFKSINDAYGHATGDGFLIGIAENMQLALRETDTLARIGGDEFIALVTNLDDLEDLNPVSQRLLEAAAQSVNVDGREIAGSASIGIARYPLDGEDSGMLIRCADQAMYEAKQQGKRRLHVFDRGLLRVSETRGNVEAALARGEFEIFYQPKINLISGEIVGAEALSRWNHPQRGLLQPAEFLPLIDRENLHLEFGDWVITEAIKQIDLELQSKVCLPISVNIAGVHLRQNNFIDSIVAKMQSSEKTAGQLLEIEILETSALDDVNAVAKIITMANTFGIRFSLDDFGTGFSSLTHLRRLPVSTVKIDTSFVRDMLESEEDAAIVSSIISLCLGLGRNVVAEGVSSVAHARALVNMQCIYGQGFGIARPMCAQEFNQWIVDWEKTNIWRALMSSDDSQPG
ncbi:EAL domain-containing protein [Congregibacter variabilis]|uniref:EAL domain-containing protein n=1 Tax=Congregibacter variabilis TaxID=3081200 RepID=A0ABZ0I0R7_9GAMM|nr:EAL domain-containing protein [Congregibacter sp. IMCC43200]